MNKEYDFKYNDFLFRKINFHDKRTLFTYYAEYYRNDPFDAFEGLCEKEVVVFRNLPGFIKKSNLEDGIYKITRVTHKGYEFLIGCYDLYRIGIFTHDKLDTNNQAYFKEILEKLNFEEAIIRYCEYIENYKNTTKKLAEAQEKEIQESFKEKIDRSFNK